jgi:hypothetical protein
MMASFAWIWAPLIRPPRVLTPIPKAPQQLSRHGLGLSADVIPDPAPSAAQSRAAPSAKSGRVQVRHASSGACRRGRLSRGRALSLATGFMRKCYMAKA